MNDKVKACFLIAGILLYVICPVDLVPDFLIGPGQIDDGFAAVFGGSKAVSLLRR